MKTITFSDSHVAAIAAALQARVSFFEAQVVEAESVGLGRQELMFFRDQLDVAKQALELVTA